MKKFISSALIALAAVAFVGCNKSNPGDVALAYTKASIEGASVAEYVEPSTENKDAIDASVKAAAEQLKATGVTYKEYKVASVEENGDEATVQISSTFTINGQEQSATSPLKMKKIDGKWYLAASNFEALQQMLQAQQAQEAEGAEEATEEGAEEATEEGAEEAPEAEEVQE